MANSNENSKKFQPEQHLERRDGDTYLPLKWRLAWLRSEQPQAQVWTRLVSHNNGLAIFQAKIKVPDGGVATGWGASASSSEQNDSTGSEVDLSYIAEAENQALERALTVLGYGTEYASEFDAPMENESIALNVVTLPGVASTPPAPVPTPAPTPARQNLSISENRVRYEEENSPNEPDEPEAAAPDETEEEEDETPEAAPLPTNIRSVSRTPITPAPPSNVTPMSGQAANRGGLSSTPRPLNKPTPVTQVAPAASHPTIGNSAVNDRIKGIDDSRLVLAIKQIYHEARSIYGLDEAKVDQRSIRTYNLPANELNLEQAEEFLERIKNGPRKG